MGSKGTEQCISCGRLMGAHHSHGICADCIEAAITEAKETRELITPSQGTATSLRPRRWVPSKGKQAEGVSRD